MADFWSSIAAAPPDITILSKQFVSPSSPTPHHTIPLPFLDTVWRELHYNRRLLFYLPPPDDPPAPASPPLRHPPSHVSQQLRRSLSDCLVHYFPWCGRLAPASDPSDRLSIDCNDAGVEFVEASVDMPILSLAPDGFQMKPFFEHLCQMPDSKGESAFSSPLLSVQVNTFSDGGFALGIAQSHIVADGQSLWNFMISWAECSKGVPLSLPPLHDRNRLILQEPSMEMASSWSLRQVVKEEEDPEAMAALCENKGKTAETARPNAHVSENSPRNAGSSSGGAPIPSVQCALQLSSSAVKKLKSEAGEGFSSYTIVCAHLWQRITAARQLESNASTYFAVLADCRNRLVPPLPRAYFGNVISFNKIDCTSDKICSETLHATANRIQQLVTIAQGTIANFIHYLEIHHRNLLEIVLIEGGVFGKGHNVASSPRFPIYEVDFGWGNPAAVRSAKVAGEGEIVFFAGRPGSSPGSMEICTALPASVLKLLLDDPLFLLQLTRSSSHPDEKQQE